MNDSMYELKLLMIYLILIKNEDKTCIRKKISSILKKINLYEDDDKIDKILSNLKADNLTSLLSEGTKLMNQYKNEMVNSQIINSDFSKEVSREHTETPAVTTGGVSVAKPTMNEADTKTASADQESSDMFGDGLFD
mmetsp:Transcript_13508/g.20258  ORF Transcript_13508/g.20258 Transcript_13508/m.20258 type:complete len:137 (+) Transcript_13508:1299-1709(+)